MFGIKSKNKVVVVTTKNELAAAISHREPCIEIKGELAKKVKWIEKVSSTQKKALVGVLQQNQKREVVSVDKVLLAHDTGIEPKVVILILACGLSITLIIGILRGYDIEVSKTEDKNISNFLLCHGGLLVIMM